MPVGNNLPPLTDRAGLFPGDVFIQVDNQDGFFVPPGNTNLTVNFWAAFSETPSVSFEIIKVGSSPGDVTKEAWGIFLDTSRNIGMFSCDGLGYSFLIPAFPLQLNKWYMFTCIWDNSGGVANMEVDVYDTTNILGSFVTGGRFLNQFNYQPLRIGGIDPPQAGLRGRMDKIGIWKHPDLQGPLGGVLWNNGSGMRGIDVIETVGVQENIAAYYDMDNRTASSTWTDLLGAHNGSANGEIISVPPAGEF